MYVIQILIILMLWSLYQNKVMMLYVAILISYVHTYAYVELLYAHFVYVEEYALLDNRIH